MKLEVCCADLVSLRAAVEGGAHRVELCQALGINFFGYISDVINRAALMQPNTDIKEYRALLPDKWKAL